MAQFEQGDKNHASASDLLPWHSACEMPDVGRLVDRQVDFPALREPGRGTHFDVSIW